MNQNTQASFTFPLSPGQQKTLANILKTGNYRPIAIPHTSIAAEIPDCKIALYNSGKCVIQGKGAGEFVTFVLEPIVLQAARLGYEEILNPEAFSPHMGIDESGKGDFFGPLVIAGAFVNKELAVKLKEMDVKDSKAITSDRKAMQLGSDIRTLLGSRCTVVKIGPAAYNRLYAKLRNVNAILSWGHARCIENILKTVPDCPMAISDQFGSKSQVERALMRDGKKIELIQRHKAESDIAVAAASIIARETFLRSLIEMGTRYSEKIPKGASDLVRTAAVSLVSRNKPAILLETVKCHFKTTDAVLAQLGLDRKSLGPQGEAVSKAKPQAGKP